MPPKLTPAEQKVVEEFRNKILDIETAVRLTYNEKDSDQMVAKMIDYITTLLLAHRAEVEEMRTEAWKEAVNLANKIELQEPDGGTKQWMAFKVFRNTLRDKIKDQSELDQPTV